MNDVKVKAIRGFRGVVGNEFKEVAKGETVTVSYLFAQQLFASNKAEPVGKVTEPEAPDYGDRTTAEIVAEEKKEQADAVVADVKEHTERAEKAEKSAERAEKADAKKGK